MAPPGAVGFHPGLPLRCHATAGRSSWRFPPATCRTAPANYWRLATAVDGHTPPQPEHPGAGERTLNFLLATVVRDRVAESLAFIGELSIALARLVTGRSNTRFEDFRHFCYQAGPEALGIISLTSVLVGMILAYLGAVQLQQFGAGLYVANLVTIGILREMGVLMTAVVMAGRTGAVYAAQLGTMQTNEEIDASPPWGYRPWSSPGAAAHPGPAGGHALLTCTPTCSASSAAASSPAAWASRRCNTSARPNGHLAYITWRWD